MPSTGHLGEETAQVAALAGALAQSRESSVIGGDRLSLAGATLFNAYLVTAVTMCDVHRATMTGLAAKPSAAHRARISAKQHLEIIRQRLRLAEESLAAAGMTVQVGAAWTTDAPFRETAEAIAAAQEAGILAVEMEAAALDAFATARKEPVLCFAHVTNQMGRIEGDFEKGVADGAEESLNVVSQVARRWRDLERP